MCLQLLAKAGYKGSGGLGPQESGITSPIPAWHNQGRLGIGSGSTQQPATSSHRASRAGNLSVREVSRGLGEGSDASRAVSQQQQQQQPRKRSKPPQKDWASVRVEENLQVFDAVLHNSAQHISFEKMSHRKLSEHIAGVCCGYEALLAHVSDAQKCSAVY